MTVTERPAEIAHVEAVKALLEAAVAGASVPVKVLTWAEALTSKGSLPSLYVLVQVSRRYRPNQGMAAMDTAESRRVSVGWVADVEDNAHWLASRCNGAIEHAVLTVGDRQSTRLQFETNDPVVPDDGMFSGSASYTYVI